MIQKELANAAIKAVKKLYDIELTSVKFERARGDFGDFTTNVAFQLAGSLKKTPREIAAALASEMKNGYIEKVEAAGAGFINVTLTNGYWLGRLDAIDDNYAKNDLGRHKKTQVEFISANPTGPLTIGNARGGFIGDVLSRILQSSGYDVTREYYFNDAGMQTLKLVESVKMEAGVMPETDERQYRGQYISELAAKYDRELRELDDDELRKLLTQEMIESQIKPAIAKMGIKFDVWFNETTVVSDGTLENVIRRLDEMGLVYERDGAVWLKTGELGDERGERVIVKSNGAPTYMAPDIAYHANIFGERKFDYAIKVLGPDHLDQFPSVYSVVHTLFPKSEFRMASYQWLRVIKDGKEVKVSKRLGQFITIADLIDLVGQPVAKFLTLMRSADSHMDFDLDLAEERSAKNPYFYVMYAYARANSILCKANEKGLSSKAGEFVLNEYELAILKRMDELPSLVRDIALDFGVHKLTFFGHETAKLFTDYYENVRVLDLDEENAAHRLYFLDKFVTFMDVYWSLMGIEPQKEMRS